MGLDIDLVRRAREEEMAFFDKMGAHTRVDKSEVEANNGKLVVVRWVDVNKGDMASPNYRPRLVGREFNTYKDDSLYAATPPLEALRLVISHAAANLPGRNDGGRELMVNDVSRAYFYAPARRALYMRLPPEDKAALPGQVGKLNVCLYGTRDAARGWQENLTEHLLSLGFNPGKKGTRQFMYISRRASLQWFTDTTTYPVLPGVNLIGLKQNWASATPSRPKDFDDQELAKMIVRLRSLTEWSDAQALCMSSRRTRVMRSQWCSKL